MKREIHELALFAGAGGGILAGHLLGWRTVCAVEWEPYPASVLCARQNDGLLPPFPIWDDIRTFDARPWAGIVDVVSGGFPCQDISAAGKGDGLDGARSSMWFEMARVVSEVRPQFVFVENSPMLTTRGGVRVIGDLTSLGYDCRWTVMGAADVGAPHQRDRMWIVARWRGNLPHAQHNRIRWWEQQQKSIEEKTSQLAYTDLSHEQREGKSIGIQERFTRVRDSSFMVSDTTSKRQQRQGKFEQSIGSKKNSDWKANFIESIGRSEQWATEPNLGRVANGVAARMDRLKAIGNGQVPLCAATAWQWLTKEWL